MVYFLIPFLIPGIIYHCTIWQVTWGHITYFFLCTFHINNVKHLLLQAIYLRTFFINLLIIPNFLIFKDLTYLFLERGGGREKEKERNMDVWKTHLTVACCTCPTGDLAHNPGKCPDWESKWRLFGSQAGTHSNTSQGLIIPSFL